MAESIRKWVDAHELLVTIFLTLGLFASLWLIIHATPALAKHHKKKGHPTPKPTPSARIRNPVNAPDHAELRPEDLMWLNQ